MPSKNRDVSKKQIEWEKKQEEAARKEQEEVKKKKQNEAAEPEYDISAIPANFPDDIQYLTQPTWSDAITPEQRSQLGRTSIELEGRCKVSAAEIAATPKTCAITIIQDEKHPAHGQRGLFAAEHLEPDRFVCLYLGHVHNNSLSDTDPYSDYDLCFDRDIDLSVDASKSGNQSRCANDYRGIAERPNSEFRDCFIKVPCTKRAGGTKWERRVGIFVLSAGKAAKRKHGIKAGEEILISYGKQFWESRKLMAEFRKDFEMLEIANAALEH
ncbi:hypothetical protein Q7P37_006358 [Cladosporium fusiforme]